MIVRHITRKRELHMYQINTISPHDTECIVSWNPKDPFEQETKACVHELFTTTARYIPNAEAVCGWDGTLTYEELDHLSSIAAARLIGQGVKPGTTVPFAYDKSVWAVVATMAIVKAGAALVPLNPHDPLARLEEIIRSLDANVVVTMQNFVEIFENLVTHVTVFSKETLFGNGCKLLTPSPSVSLSDPIFILFTSGSTGRPKGMIHTHRSIATHALTHGAAMSYHGARVLHFAAYAFDVAFMDIFTTLLFGGCICVPSESDRKSNIISVINDMRVDHAILTPSFAGLIQPAEVPTLKTLAVGGEALPQDRVRRWADHLNLLQIYGPAEVGICMMMKMRFTTPGAMVGFPLDNSSCWLVDPDDDSRLVPIGATGELLVAGPSVARGYVNDEARTQLSFVDPPMWASKLGLPFKVFYKSGDLLRYNIDAFDGSYIFVGRKDSQIKLRGQRIEAGEVEYHIGHLPGVAYSVVLKPDKGCYAGKLLAIVQLEFTGGSRARLVDGDIHLAETQDLTAEILRHRLEKVLPMYMIPDECLVVRNIPFVPSLKIDRRRISTWVAEIDSRPQMKGITTISRIDPKEVTAAALSKYVAKSLAADDGEQSLRLEAHDFRLFDTGIDSIKTISISMFIQREYGLTVPMDALMDPKTTIRELAHWVDSQSPLSVNDVRSLATPSSFRSREVNVYDESLALTKALVKNLEHKIAITEDTETKNHSINSTNGHLQSRNIFLTGSSGYLGSDILRQLLKISHVQVYVTFRCQSTSSGFERVKEIALQAGWWRPSYEHRITICPGDLSSPDLGLAPRHQQQLNPPTLDTSSTNGSHAVPPYIDTIIHAGAKVHYTLPYTTLFPINVSSTLDLLRFSACSPYIHTFIHISGGESPDVDSLSMDPDYLASLSDASGYTLTKNIAERVVRDAAGHTPPSTFPPPLHLGEYFATKKMKVVKPGYIIGSASSGFRANTSDFLWRLIAGCVEIGAYNVEEEGRWVFVDDVERVARRAVDLITPTSIPGHTSLESQEDGTGAKELRFQAKEKEMDGEEAKGKGKGKGKGKKVPGEIDRVLSGLRFDAIWQVLAKVYSRRFEALPAEAWMRMLREKAIEKGEKGLLFPLLGVLEREGGRIGCDFVGKEEEGEEARMKSVVEGNVRWLIETGFLPAVS